jgi:osmoprotectant transport system substrate-binding protein
MRSTATLAVMTALALVFGACGGGGSDTSDAPPLAQTPIRIGTKNFTEQYILGELYSQALKAKGFKVENKGKIGSTEITHRALAAGALDMYPEYMGVLLSEIAHKTDRPKSAAETYRLAQDFEERAGLTLLRASPFSNANVLVVKPAYARRHRLRSIADLKRLKGPVRLAAFPEFRNRYEGLTGLRRRYGLSNLKLVALEDGNQRYPPLNSGEVDVTLGFTTDGQLLGNGYVMLKDPQGVFAAGHAAPVIKRDLLEAYGPALASAIDAVTAKLTTPIMRRMNKAVDIDGHKPAEVATRFLRSQGLVR